VVALQSNGSLVVAATRERGDFERFARRTQSHRLIDANELGAMEPDLAGRFTSALYFPDEAHMPAPAALEFMLAEVQRAGVEIVLGGTPPAEANDTIIDCNVAAIRMLGFESKEALLAVPVRSVPGCFQVRLLQCLENSERRWSLPGSARSGVNTTYGNH